MGCHQSSSLRLAVVFFSMAAVERESKARSSDWFEPPPAWASPAWPGVSKNECYEAYVLQLFISLKYITANVVDRNNGRIVVTASTIEHSVKDSLECGRSCNAKAASVVGEVLAMRLKVEGLDQGQVQGIHVNVNSEVEKKGFKNRTKVWAIVNALKNNGVKLVLDDNDEDSSRPS
ncbi:uncharacterized protein LOC126792474 [Argentina anserina]|uniref:uncharacterized protein LOC126792474 n=1 Tax=Argentina anserina TaxID=57926 RepID=UPI0021764ABA|nr:uncharacterized protein LOC126792474 [Potentilla anserina]